MQEFKCPCCNGAIEFDTDSQKLKCPYCGTEFDIDTLSDYNNDLSKDGDDNMEWDASAGADWQQGESDGLRVYTCNTCGGEIVCDNNTAATSCPYCGNPVAMTGQLSGVLKPDYVIPFRLDKKAAKEALKKHYKGKVLLPKVFKDENRIEEIKGIYVPFWLFDTQSDAHIRYKATKVRSWSDSNYYYTETSHYSVTRGGTMSFEKVPVDGSSKIDDALMESIEPFDFSKAVDFQTAYLAGFLADKYDVTSEQSTTRANARIKRSTEDTFRKTVNGYNTVSAVASNVSFKNSSAKYALLPVWMLSTKWKDQNYVFAMNGQTGKFVGDLPVDKSAFWRWFFGLTAAITGAVFLLFWLLWLI